MTITGVVLSVFTFIIAGAAALEIGLVFVGCGLFACALICGFIATDMA
jgi:hypothetical protein